MSRVELIQKASAYGVWSGGTLAVAILTADTFVWWVTALICAVPVLMAWRLRKLIAENAE